MLSNPFPNIPRANKSHVCTYANEEVTKNNKFIKTECQTIPSRRTYYELNKHHWHESNMNPLWFKHDSNMISTWFKLDYNIT